MDLERIRALKDKLAADLAADGSADAAAPAGAAVPLAAAQGRLSIDDPIYISSPSHETIGRALAIDEEVSPSGSAAGAAQKKKRWAAVRGVFGALGKFKKGKKGAAGTSPGAASPGSVDATETLPSAASPGAVDAAASSSAAAGAPGGIAQGRLAALETGLDAAGTAGAALPAGASAEAPARPDAPEVAAPPASGAADAGAGDSPLRTAAIEPTPRAALVQPAEPGGEEIPRVDPPPAASPKERGTSPSAACSAEEPTSAVSPTTVPQVVGAADPSAAIPATPLSPLRQRELTSEPTAWEKKLQQNVPHTATHHDADTRTRPPMRKGAGPVAASFSAVGSLIPTGLWGKARKPDNRFAASRYANLGIEPDSVKEKAISILATELERREIARRRKAAADAIFAELLRLEMEASVCLELDNLERQRSRIQASEEEEEERWRRIQEHHLHASTPLYLQSERQASLEGVLEAEARERAWRMSEDGIQSMSGRSKYADDSRKAINAEFCRIVWPGVESWAPIGEQEIALPPGQSRHNPAAVLYFCLSQRNLLHKTPRVKLVTLEAMKTGRQDPALQEIQVQATDRHETAQLKPPSKVETLRTVKLVPSAPPSVIKESEAAQNAPKMGWFDSLKATVTHIAEDTVEGVSHFAEQASEAATKSVDVAASAVPSLPSMPTMPSLNLGQFASPREWEIPGASLLSPKKSSGVESQNVDPAKKLDFA